MALTKYTIKLSRSKDEHPTYTVNSYANSYEEAVDEAKMFVSKNGFWSTNTSIDDRMKSINVYHVIPDNSVIINAEVISSCILDLITGIVGIMGLFIAVSLVIREYYINGIKQALGISLPMTIFALLCLLLTVCLNSYIHRKPFVINFITPKDYSDIVYIKKKYIIIEMNDEFTAFIEKKYINEWYSFKVSQDVHTLYQKLFKENKNG